MHLADAYMQSNFHWIQGTVYILSVHAFNGNRIHDLRIANTILNCLSYR